LEEAVTCLRRAVELNPSYPEAQSNLGNALLKLRQPEEAVACLRRGPGTRPGPRGGGAQPGDGPPGGGAPGGGGGGPRGGRWNCDPNCPRRSTTWGTHCWS